jgi:hypothetical protein
MVLEITNENVYIGIIVVLAAIQIFQWRKVDMLERIMSSIIDDIKTEQKNNFKKATSEDADRLLAEIERILKPIPEISDLQKKRIDQAITAAAELT